MKPEKDVSILIRFKTIEERRRFARKCFDKDMTYREGIMDWVNQK